MGYGHSRDDRVAELWTRFRGESTELADRIGWKGEGKTVAKDDS